MNVTTVSPAALRIVRILAGNPPQSMEQLVAATGVTRTAISEQLKDLVSRELVERTTERVERGRPRHLYTATDLALSTLLPNNQRLIVPALLRAVWEVAGSEVARDVMNRVSDELAQHYREQITAENPADRLREFAELLADEGILTEVSQRDGHLALRLRSCPYTDMIDEERQICTAEHQMLDGVIGEPLTIVGCRLDGCPSCTFELAVGG